jgi:hypothetical protein
MQNTIDHHRAFPHVSLEHYVRSRQIELAKELESRKSIYLDLKFWIALRKVESGESNNSSGQKLLQKLRDLVSSGKVYCPISDSTFLEIFKQSDLLTRRATVNLVDELSLGVSLISSELRANTEISHFIHAATSSDVYPLDQLVWTKLSYVLGYVHPSSNAFDPTELLAMQKAFFDHMWLISLTEADSLIGDNIQAPDLFQKFASKLNDANALHAHQLRSFAQTYQIELEGILVLCTETVAKILNAKAKAQIGEYVEPGSPSWDQLKQDCFSLLLQAFKKESTKDALRTIHINTCLQASLRWDKTRLFKENDLMDFQHAAAAIGYCDAFFTERSLSTMVKRQDLALDKRYFCYVGSTIEDAIEYLESNF